MEEFFDQYGLCVLIVTQLSIVMTWSLIKLSEMIDERKPQVEKIRMNDDFQIDCFKSNFEIVNQLCEIQYEWSGNSRYKDKMTKHIDAALSQYRPVSGQVEILNNYFNRFMPKEVFEGLNRSEILLLQYHYAGFSTKSICNLLGISEDAFYVRRHRLKSKLAKKYARTQDGLSPCKTNSTMCFLNI